MKCFRVRNQRMSCTVRRPRVCTGWGSAPLSPPSVPSGGSPGSADPPASPQSEAAWSPGSPSLTSPLVQLLRKQKSQSFEHADLKLTGIWGQQCAATRLFLGYTCSCFGFCPDIQCKYIGVSGKSKQQEPDWDSDHHSKGSGDIFVKFAVIKLVIEMFYTGLWRRQTVEKKTHTIFCVKTWTHWSVGFV